MARFIVRKSSEFQSKTTDDAKFKIYLKTSNRNKQIIKIKFEKT